MSEEKEKEPGFFAQIQNQIIAGVGIVITTAGGLVVTNMEAIFTPQEPETIVIEEPAQIPQQDIIINIPEQKQKETIIIKEVPVEKKTTKKEKEKEHESW